MLKFNPLLLWLIALLLASCLQNVEIKLPNHTPLLVVNSLLTPDSTIKVQLTQSLATTNPSKDFPKVNNASIKLYENDVFLATLHFSGNGTYTLDYQPKVGFKYKIIITAPDFPEVSAEDIIPEKPNLQILEKLKSEISNELSFKFQINDIIGKENVYWFFLQELGNRDPNCSGPPTCCRDKLYSTIPQYLISKSGAIDKFNGSYDNLEGAYGIDYYFRIEDKSFTDANQKIDFYYNYNSFCNMEKIEDFKPDGEAVYLNLINSSPHFDRYLKSSILYFRATGYSSLDSEVDAFRINPFVETVQIYSNIKNGTGIFAAYNIHRVFIND
jgi:hypothetical protein